MATRSMRERVLRMFTILGGITFFFMILALLGAFFMGGKKNVPERVLLELDLRAPIADAEASDLVAEVLRQTTTSVRDVVETLERAGTDERVAGLVVYFGGEGHGMAVDQEIRDALFAFRNKGKFAIGYADTFGEFGPGNQAYYVATACDEIWLQPSGDVGFNGLVSEAIFIRGTLDLLGIVSRMDQRYEYKNAMNMFTEKQLTPAHREALAAILEDEFGQIVQGVSQARGISEEQVKKLADAGPYLGPEAQAGGLVDKLGYRDEMLAAAKQRAGEGATLLFSDTYLELAGRPHDTGKRIALIYGVGPVTRQRSNDPIFGESTMDSESVTAAFRAAIRDDDVKAILFRVESPGGSYVASDSIWREVKLAREAGKPVIVSMGNVAGSGGYFVAMGANKIVAQPGTITGSIGVLGGKQLMRDTWGKIGITWDDVSSSQNATMFLATHDFTEHGWKRFQAWLDRVYTDFTGKVAEGRGLTIEQVHAIAKGRIWSGQRAKKLGLVDELGGFSVVAVSLKKKASIDADANIELRLYPRKKSMFELLTADEPSSSDDPIKSPVSAGPVQRWLPIGDELRALGLLEHDPGVLTMPAFRITE